MAKITTEKLRRWHSDLACAPKFVRSKIGAPRSTRAVDLSDEDTARARRATANRVLTILKAALNHSYQAGQIVSDNAWRRVRPFRAADAPVVRYLLPDECRRLLDACEPDFRLLVRGALATGCRYGELVRMRIADFDSIAQVVTVRVSKSAKSRHVPLDNLGLAFLAELTKGKAGNLLIFSRSDGAAWGAAHQIRRLSEASEKAGIIPAATFHTLRHTYASALARAGVPIQFIAHALGHADTRITTKHYAHLAPSAVADAIRHALTGFSIQTLSPEHISRV